MRDEARLRFHRLLTSFSHGMLVTRSVEGNLRARPLAVAGVEANDDVWFVTRLESGKVIEVLADARICVAFQRGARYLSLSGRATVVCDSSKLEELWKERWRIWFPDGASDRHAVLLKVNAEIGEFWDRSGLAAIRYVFQAGRAYLAGREVTPGPEQHRTVSLQDSAAVLP